MMPAQIDGSTIHTEPVIAAAKAAEDAATAATTTTNSTTRATSGPVAAAVVAAALQEGTGDSFFGYAITWVNEKIATLMQQTAQTDQPGSEMANVRRERFKAAYWTLLKVAPVVAILLFAPNSVFVGIFAVAAIIKTIQPESSNIYMNAYRSIGLGLGFAAAVKALLTAVTISLASDPHVALVSTVIHLGIAYFCFNFVRNLKDTPNQTDAEREKRNKDSGLSAAAPAPGNTGAAARPAVGASGEVAVGAAIVIPSVSVATIEGQPATASAAPTRTPTSGTDATPLSR